MLEVNFSVNNLLSILTCFVGFLYAFQIATLKKTNVSGNRFFTLYLLTLSLIVFFFFMIDLDLRIKSINLLLVLFIVPSALLLAPFIWLYIRKLISDKPPKKVILHFLPAIITSVTILISGLIFWFTTDVALKMLCLKIMTIVVEVSLVVFFVAQNIVYIILSIVGYKRHRGRMEQIYSYSEEVDLSWTRVLVVGYIVLIFGLIAVNVMGGKKNEGSVDSIANHSGKLMVVMTQNNRLKTGDRVTLSGFDIKEYNGNFEIVSMDNKSFYLPKVSFEGDSSLQHVVIESNDKFISELSNFLFTLIILFYIIYTGHKAMKQRSITISELPESNEEVENEKDKNLSESQLLMFQKIKEDLLNVMNEEKPYLDQNLNIFTLAKRLNSNSKYLSQIINQEFNKSFVHFVNEYRIEAAKQVLLANNNNYTIEAQSQMVGFKSKSSFNIAFKRHTGLTPSLFIQGNR